MKYLDLTGLSEVWANIKSYISSKIPTKTSQLQNDSNYATTSQLPSKTSQLTNDSDFTTNAKLATKQDTISDLATIRSGASKGATAVQPSELTSKANDSDVVHKSGNETIEGTKTFSKARTKFYKSLDLYHDEDYKLNTNPSVKTYQYVFFTGKSGWYSAFLENKVDTDGASYCSLTARNTNEQSASVQLAIDSKNDKTFTPLTNDDISLGTSTSKWKAVYATTFNGNLVGNADSSTRASCLENYSLPAGSRIYLDWDTQKKGYVGLKVGNTVMGGLITTNNIGSHIAGNDADSYGGSWIRFKNGIQMCWGSGSFEEMISYPKAFNSSPKLSCVPYSDVAQSLVVNVCLKTKTLFAGRLWNVHTRDWQKNGTFDWFAIGTWN